MKTINLTPTWSAMMPAIIAALESGTIEGRETARAELMELAKAVDSLNNQTTTGD